jgi:hypothetical protein
MALKEKEDDPLEKKALEYLNGVRDSAALEVANAGKSMLSNPKSIIKSGVSGGLAGVAAESAVDLAQNAIVGDVSSNPYAQALRTTANRLGGGALSGAAVAGPIGAIKGAIVGGVTDIATNVVDTAKLLPEAVSSMYGAYVEAPKKEKKQNDMLASVQQGRSMRDMALKKKASDYLASAYY